MAPSPPPAPASSRVKSLEREFQRLWLSEGMDNPAVGRSSRMYKSFALPYLKQMEGVRRVVAGEGDSTRPQTKGSTR